MDVVLGIFIRAAPGAFVRVLLSSVAWLTGTYQTVPFGLNFANCICTLCFIHNYHVTRVKRISFINLISCSLSMHLRCLEPLATALITFSSTFAIPKERDFYPYFFDSQ